MSGNIYDLFRTWLKAHPVGRILYAPFDVKFSERDVVEAYKTTPWSFDVA